MELKSSFRSSCFQRLSKEAFSAFAFGGAVFRGCAWAFPRAFFTALRQNQEKEDFHHEL